MPRHILRPRPFPLLMAVGASALLVACNGATREAETLPVAGGQEEHYEARPDQPIQAAMSRYQQRLSEDGTVPPNALMRAKEQRDALLNGQGFGPGISSEEWTWIGPGNIGGRLRPIIIHPDNPDVIWVGSASGGIWKTTSGGADWQPMDDFMASLSVACMAIDPSNPDVLYAGTGEGFFETVEGSSNTAAVRGAGIFKSIDAGVTWDQLPATTGEDFYFVNRMIIDPNDNQSFIVATTSGIWRSTDAGATWTLRAAFKALDVVADPTDFSKQVAGGHHQENGPYFSTDSGQTWTQAAGAGGHRQELAYAPSDPTIVYAMVSGDNNRMKAWRSTDAGQTYSLMTDGGGPQTWASYNSTIWVDPTNPDFLIVGGVWLFRSQDAGVSFQQRFGDVHADMHNIVAHPDFDGDTNRTVYFGTDGGFWRTDNVYGSDAFNLNNNLGVTQFYGARINPTTGHVIGGTQDNGTLFYSGDKQNWAHIFGGDGGYGAADPTDPDYFYGEVQYARLHRSTNGGQSSSYIFQGPNPIGDAGTANTNFIPYFTLDPNNPETMLVTCRRLWRSRNVKASQPDWFSIKDSIGPPGPDLPAPRGAHFAPNDPRNISTVEVALGNSDLIWAAHNNGQVWFTTNGTADQPGWTRVDENGVGLPDRWVSQIEVDPMNHDRVYLSFMGWESDNLWLTEDSGQSWTQITGSGDTQLPAAPASALAVHNTKPGLIYVGTDIGVFTSDDDGATWSVSTQGPGTVPVEELVWKNNNTLMAVTHGRGIFIAELGSFTALDSLSMAFGTLVGGEVGDLEESDDVYVQTRSKFGFTAFEPNVMDVRIGMSTDVPDPQYLDVTIESRIDHPVGEAKIRLRNYDTSAFDQIGSYPIGTAEEIHMIEAIDAADYVRQDGGRILLSIRHVLAATFTAQGFDSFIDQVEVRVQ